MPRNVLIRPLRKRTQTGALYTRDSAVAELLLKLSWLPRDQLVTRAAISRKGDPDYIPSECLVYFLRASSADRTETWFEQLYRTLAERVLRALPRAENPDGTESLTRGAIRDKVFGRFVELLSADRTEYCEKLDFFEVRFDGALANLRRDAQKKVWRDENRSAPLEYSDDTGEPTAEVEQAAGNFDPFAEIGDADYRLRLDAAIEVLPPEQRRIIEMLRLGFPIDSKDQDTMTIATALGRAEKTIRTYRDKAIATLRAILTEGDRR